MQDLAAVEAEGAVVSQTVQFPGIDNATIAARIGSREIAQYSTPLAKVQFDCNRDGWNVSPGDIIKYKNDGLGITELIVRVFSVNYGTLLNGDITIDGTQDIFTLPQASYLAGQETNWVEPVQLPVPSPATALFELPYYEIVTNFSDGDQSTFDSFTSFLQVLATAPASASASYQLWLSSTSSIPDFAFDIDGAYTATVEIVPALAIPTSETNETVSFANGKGLFFDIELGSYAYIDDEVVEIVAMDVGVGTVTIKRAVMDSTPQPHSASSILYFVEGQDTQGTLQYIGDPVTGLGGDTAYARVLTQTDIGVLAIGDSTELTIDFIGRQARPFPPAALKIEGDFFPTVRLAPTGDTTTLTWHSRNRLLQITKPFNSFYSTSGVNVSEEETDFYINVHDENDLLVNIIKVDRQPVSTSYTYDYTILDEARDANLIAPGNEVLLDTISATNPSNLAASFPAAGSEARARPTSAIITDEKVYAEFTVDNESFCVGVSNNETLYRATDTLNIAYLRVKDNTVIGSATGSGGTGTITGGIGAIAIDVVAKTFWLRNTNGTWRDGDPQTSTGGISFSTLTTTVVEEQYFYLAVANDGVTAPTEATEISFNFGASAFSHSVPTGFSAYRPDAVATTVVDNAEIGTGLVIGPDLISVSSTIVTIWQRAKTITTKTEGRWYFEAIPTRIDDTTHLYIGVQASTGGVATILGAVGEAGWAPNGDVRVDGTVVVTTDTYTIFDRIGVAVDATNNQVQFFKNGEAVGVVHTITVTDIVPSISIRSLSADVRFSFRYLPTIATQTAPPVQFSLFDIVDGPTTQALNNSIRFDVYSGREEVINSETVLIESWQHVNNTLTF